MEVYNSLTASINVVTLQRGRVLLNISITRKKKGGGGFVLVGSRNPNVGNQQ